MNIDSPLAVTVNTVAYSSLDFALYLEFAMLRQKKLQSIFIKSVKDIFIIV